VNLDRNQHTWSIFRDKGEYTEARRHYEESLPSRFHLSSSRVSWEVEGHPPVYLPPQEDNSSDAQGSRTCKRLKSDYSDDGNDSSSTASDRTAAVDDAHSESTKMRYKCKLCGQLKQNHSCPYQQPLQRSIGVMVYPAVNAFTAAEPGAIAKPLTKMNNFVSYYPEQGSPQVAENTPRSSLGTVYGAHPSTITPETPHVGPVAHSPQSSISAQSSEDPAIACARPPPHGPSGTGRGWKRTQDRLSEHTRDSRFAASVFLRPEQYRAVTPLKKDTSNNEQDVPTTASTSYQYPAVPLSFAERKRMSDTLFYLSREIPSMTTDCAAALRAARQNREWDLAVAELLTQIVVGLYCSETDSRLDGLRQYLLTIGISC
jgi:hypothetical protein